MGNRKQIVWVDVVRLVAIIFVVVCHAGDTFNFNAPPGDAGYAFWGSVWGALSRFCVPLFAMLTGFLLLPVSEGWGAFVRRRVGRVLPPFLLWSTVYALFPLWVALCGGTGENLRQFIPFADGQVGWAPALRALVHVPLSIGMLTAHFWYVYMLIGLYLFLPIFSPWFAQAGERQKAAFLGLWGVSLFLPYVRVYLAEPWGECAWNAFGMLYPFAGFIGYAVLGSVLGRMRELSWGRTLLIALPLLATGFLVTFIGFDHVMTVTKGDYDNHAAEIELFFTFCTPNVMAMSAAVFLLAKKVTRVPPPVARALGALNRCGFGIYCVHYAFIGAAFHYLVKPLGLPVCVQLPVTSLVAFGVVWGCVHLVRHLPGGSRIC